jgi:arginase
MNNITKRFLNVARRVNILDAPFAKGSTLNGSAHFPNIIKKYELNNLLKDNINKNYPLFFDKSQYSVGEYCNYLHDTIIHNPTIMDDFLLVLGGDHSISIGNVNAIHKLKPNTGVIWVDAHADINTSKTSPTGNIHGMPLAFLLGIEKHLIKTEQWKWFTYSGLNPKDIVYIGLRDVDEGEKKILEEYGIKYYTMNDVNNITIEKILCDVKHYFDIDNKKENIHLSFDVDSINPSILPHTGVTVEGGLDEKQAIFICKSLAKTGKLNSMELVELNTQIRNGNVSLDKSLDICIKLIENAITTK